MIEIKDCLPAHARSHFISLRNIRLDSATKSYQQKLAQSRAEAAAKGYLRSGAQQVAEWQLKEKKFEALAIGYIEDALQTCKLYDIPLTRPLCDGLVRATQDLTEAQYKSALQAQGHGIADVKIPLSVRSQMGNSPRFPGILNQVRVATEKARVEDERARIAMANKKEEKATGDVYHQEIHHSGPGPLNASQTGDIYVQNQLTTTELNDLQPALASVRTALKEENSLEADEAVGYLAGAEKAAKEGDQNKTVSLLKQIPTVVWEAGKDVGKVVISEGLKAFLKAHGIIP